MLIKYSKIIDLSLTLHSGMAIYPGDPAIEIKPRLSMPKDMVNILGLNMSTHHGTHLDAPRHQVADGEFLDKFPPNMFIQRAMKIDVLPEVEGRYTKRKDGALYRQVVTADDLAPHVERMAQVEAVVIHTGYGQLLLKGKVDEDFPYLDVSAAKLLANYKNLKVIGIDSLTVDALGENRVHHILLADGRRVLLETLVCLDQLPLDFTLCCLPLRIENADGAPCRAIALC